MGIMALSQFAKLFRAGDAVNVDITIRSRRNERDVTSHNFERFTTDNSFLLQSFDVSSALCVMTLSIRVS